VPTTDSASLCVEQVARRRLEELHHCAVLEGRGVRQVDDDVGILTGFRQALARERVDAGVGRCRYDVVTVSTQQRDDFGADEPSAADDDEFHDWSFLFHAEAFAARPCRLDRAARALVTAARNSGPSMPVS
jgi:hypothetical protein